MAKNTSSKIFIEALFVAAPNWKPSTCLFISSLPILSPQYVCLCSCLHTPEYLVKINTKWTSMFSLGTYNDIRFKIPSFFFFFFFFTFFVILEISRLTKSWYFQVHSKVTQVFVHMYPFSMELLSHLGYHRTLRRAPWASYFKHSDVIGSHLALLT